MASGKKGESAGDKVSEYVFPGPEGSSDQLGPKAYLNKSNINKFKFKFTDAKDITAALGKKGKDPAADTGGLDKFSKGRVGISSMICEYPDGSTSTKVAIENCVIQRRTNAKGQVSREQRASRGGRYDWTRSIHRLARGQREKRRLSSTKQRRSRPSRRSHHG
jgi:hypothetical protein